MEWLINLDKKSIDKITAIETEIDFLKSQSVNYLTARFYACWSNTNKKIKELKQEITTIKLSRI